MFCCRLWKVFSGHFAHAGRKWSLKRTENTLTNWFLIDFSLRFLRFFKCNEFYKIDFNFGAQYKDFSLIFYVNTMNSFQIYTSEGDFGVMVGNIHNEEDFGILSEILSDSLNFRIKITCLPFLMWTNWYQNHSPKCILLFVVAVCPKMRRCIISTLKNLKTKNILKKYCG